MNWDSLYFRGGHGLLDNSVVEPKQPRFHLRLGWVLKSRISWVVTLHIAVLTSPTLSLIFPQNPQLERLFTLPDATIMTGVVLISRRRACASRRVIELLCLNTIVVASVVLTLRLKSGIPSMVLWAEVFLHSVGFYTVLGIAFMACHCRYWLVRCETIDKDFCSDRHRFSLRSLVFVVTVSAVICGLISASSRELTTGGPNDPIIASRLLSFVVLILNTSCSAHATLGAKNKSIWSRVLLVLLVAVILETCLNLARIQELFLGGWERVAIAIVSSVAPVAIAIMSLLIFRSCGFRLARQSPVDLRRVELNDGDEVSVPPRMMADWLSNPTDGTDSLKSK